MKNRYFSKITVASLIIIFLAVFYFSVYAYYVNIEVENSNYWVAHTDKVLFKSERVLSTLEDIETDSREYALTGDSIFLQSYFFARNNIWININELKQLTQNNIVQQTRITKLTDLTAKRLSLCNNLLTMRLSPTYTSESAKPLFTNGIIIMDEIKDTIVSIQQEENNLLAVREKKNKENEIHSQNIFYILFATLVLLLITIFFATRFFSILRKKQSGALMHLDTGLIFFSKRIDEIVKGISDPFFALNKDYEFTFNNVAVEKTIGQSKGSLTGKNIFTIFPQYNNNIFGSKIREVMQTRESNTFEAYEDFLGHWQDISIYPTSEGVSVHIKDATKRKDYETQLYTAQKLLEATNDVAEVGGWDVNMATGKVNWTKVTKLMYETSPDYKPDLISALNFFKEGKSKDTITKIVDDATDEQIEWDIELQIITAKGNEKWVRSKGRSEFENDVCIRLIGTVQDIDAQKKIHDLLLKSEQQFRSAFDHSLHGMLLVNAATNTIEVNKAFCQITGYTREEFLLLGIEKITHPDDKPKDNETHTRIINGDIETWHYEKRYIHKQGYIIWVEVTGSAIKDADNNIISFVAQMQDITEKKKRNKILHPYAYKF